MLAMTEDKAGSLGKVSSLHVEEALVAGGQTIAACVSLLLADEPTRPGVYFPEELFELTQLESQVKRLFDRSLVSNRS